MSQNKKKSVFFIKATALMSRRNIKNLTDPKLLHSGKIASHNTHLHAFSHKPHRMQLVVTVNSPSVFSVRMLLTQVLSVSLCRCVTAVSAGRWTLTAALSVSLRTTVTARASARRGTSTSRSVQPLNTQEERPMRTCGESRDLSHVTM